MKRSINKILLENLTEKQKERLKFMQEVLDQVSNTPLKFKSGSCLMFYYKLDRFSEDLDFDSLIDPETRQLQDLLSKLFKVRASKDTDTTL